MKKTRLLIFACAAFLFVACSKGEVGITPEENGNGGGNTGTGFPKGSTPGVIYIKQGKEGITKFDLSTGVVSSVLSHWLGAGWDISMDATKGLKQVNPSSYFTRYIIFNPKDGSTIKEISYEHNSYSGGSPYFSFDGTKIALEPAGEDGLVIMDLNGNILHNISGYGQHEFKFLDPIAWEPGGTILFKMDGGLWRTTSDFRRAFKVRDIPFDDWRGNVAASPDGKKIALSAGKHIWLMNADGSDFHAVTQSDQGEFMPTFSPDSKYIVMLSNPRAGADITTADHLCIIPADGEVYKVWPGEDNRVIQPMEKGRPDSRGVGLTVVGSFVWR